jgi:glycosyltransferase involved in cell wall biosynthesis
MKIWIVNYTALPPSEPGGTRHYSLARELHRMGHQVLVVASSFHYVARRSVRRVEDGSHLLEDVEGVPFLWLRAPAYRESKLARAWSWLVFSWRVWRQVGLGQRPPPDVVVGSSPYPFAALAAERMAARLGVPFVLEVRDLWPQTLVDLGKYSSLHPFILLLDGIERYLYRRATRIISLLPEADEYMARKGADRDHVVWIPNGVDLEMVPDPTPPSAEAPFCVMYAGAHGLSNTLDLVLDAAAILQREAWGPDRAIFKLVGDGPYKRRLIDRARQEGLKNVLFEDPVPKQEIYSVLQEADAFVRPVEDSPLYRWGASPNKLFDYMASGRPVVYASQSQRNPVNISGGGLTIPPGDPDSLAQAVRDLAGCSVEERWEMGLRGRRYVESQHAFSRLAESMAEALEAMLTDLRTNLSHE